MRIRWDVVSLAVLLLVALVVRLGALAFDGHNGDVSIMARWAERMAEVGPWRFYDGDGSIYPALLYPLWVLATDLSGEALNVAIKGLSIPFDLAIGVLLYVVVRGRSTRARGDWRGVALPVQPGRPAGRSGVGPGRQRRHPRLSRGRCRERAWP